MGIIRSCILLISKIAMCTSQTNTISSVHRLLNIQGVSDKANDVIYHPATDNKPSNILVFFGGDIQDYPENMMAHRDNKVYVNWNLENVAQLLHGKFPSSAIFVIKPVRMHLKTFSCYSNFVDTNDFGVPKYELSVDMLQHLNSLVQNAQQKVIEISGSQIDAKNTCTNSSLEHATDTSTRASLPILLIGFSKGCVVLNQLLYSLMALSKECDSNLSFDLKAFVERVETIYWLDGGHSGSSDTWITDKLILQNYCQFKIKTRIHVTPYQVLCTMRPRLGKEEKIFREMLKKLENDVERTLHFEDQPQSSENHFKVLVEFKPSE